MPRREPTSAAVPAPRPDAQAPHVVQVDRSPDAAQAWLQAAQDVADQAFLVLDGQGNLVSAAPRAADLLGEAASRPLSRIPDIVHVEDRDQVVAWLARLQRQPGPSAPVVVRAAGADGSWAFLELGGHNLLGAAAAAVVLTVRDVTAQRSLEARVHALERSYAVLVETSDALLERLTPTEVFSRVCDVATRVGGFQLAWFGVVEDGRVQPRAVAGDRHPYVESVQISVDEASERSRGPTGTAVRLRKTVICPDIQGDANMRPWRDVAEQHGYRSSIAVPVIAHGSVVGVLNVYAAQTDSFGAATAQLLERVAAYVGHAWESDQLAAAPPAVPADDLPAPTGLPERQPPSLDVTTGLLSRTGALARLMDTVAALRQGEQLHVLLVDVDGFSRLNDLYGERIGDEVLRGVAQRLRLVVRPQDVLARLHSDEFLVGIVGNAGFDSEALAGQVLDTFRSPMRVGESTRTVHVSIGMATLTPPSATAVDLVRDAGVALRRAKGRGPGQLGVYDDAARAFIRRRRELEEGLEHAAARRELLVRYQPVVSLTTGRIVGAEALVRWEHPVFGFLPPGEFIDLAEETGHIVDIGRFVIREAVQTAAAWLRTFGRGIHVAVNVSGRQFVDEGLVDAVSRALAQTGALASDLVIEVTESALAQDVGQARSTLGTLRRLGLRVAVDDFGTGYSSLAQLRRLPVDILKIDRSFVAGILSSPRDAAMVDAMVQMAGALEMAVVAEGIEQQEQVPALVAMGCGLGQGYLWSRPVDPDAVLAMLTREGAPGSGAE